MSPRQKFNRQQKTWPARAPGRLKDKVFAQDPRTLDQLKAVIFDQFHSLEQSEIAKACKSVEFSCQACITLEGRQLQLHKDYS